MRALHLKENHQQNTMLSILTMKQEAVAQSTWTTENGEDSLCTTTVGDRH